MKVEWSASQVLRNLHGFLCVYKQRDVSLASLKKLIVKRICDHGNSLQFPEVPTIQMPIVEPHERTGASVVVGLRKQKDYTLHPLVYGMPFNPMDILLEELEPMEATTSGVCCKSTVRYCILVFGVNASEEELEEVRDLVWVNEYRLNGKLGEASDKNELRGKIVARAKSDHITPITFKKLLTRLCFHYKRLSFELANVDMQSEEAFELARQGAARPRIIGSPLIYDVRLAKFDYPHFHLNMSVVSENDYFLRHFVHEVGCSMGSLARPTRVQRLRTGPFLRAHALLDSHFQLVNILKNIKMCNFIISAEKKVTVMEAKDSGKFVETFFLNPDSLNAARKQAVEEGIEEADDLRIPWGRYYNES